MNALIDYLRDIIGKPLSAAMAADLCVLAQHGQPAPIDIGQFQPTLYGSHRIACERLVDVLEEIQPIHAAHWRETEQYRADVPFNPDYLTVLSHERRGGLVLFTVRDANNGLLVGNFILYLHRSTHTQTLVATEDTFFLDKTARRGRLAFALHRYAVNVLSALGVTEVRASTKTINQAAKFFAALGYQQTAISWSLMIAPAAEA